MKFHMTHIFFDSETVTFTKEDPPSWLLDNAYNWWYEGFVLKLDVGKSIESDFQKITRVE